MQTIHIDLVHKGGVKSKEIGRVCIQKHVSICIFCWNYASNDQFELSDPRVKTTIQLNLFQWSPISGSLSGLAAVHMSLTRWQWEPTDGPHIWQLRLIY